jgi:selenocysteine lyase/cysteine desulfurase
MLKCQKDLFSLKPNITYLNCAYKGPLLKKSEEKIFEAIENERNPFKLKAPNYFQISNEIRREYSTIINSQPEEIAIQPSTSYGFANVFNNIINNAGNAVTIENEFPSGHFALEKWCANNKVSLNIIKREKLKAKDWNQKIIDSINHETKVVLLSSIHWMSGTKFDLYKIGQKCKEVKAYFIVDGTQSVGASKINVKELNIDAMICAGYKWLFGPYSMALGYFSEKFHNGTPIEESWMNRTNAEDFSNLTDYDPNYKTMAGRYNVGETTNFLLSPIMLAGLKQINNWGISNIEDYCSALAEILVNELKPIGILFEDEDYFKPHLFSLGLPEKVDLLKFKEKLESNNIYVSLRGKNIRVSINVFNNEKEIGSLVSLVKKSLNI